MTHQTAIYAAGQVNQKCYLAMNGFWITTKQPSKVVRRFLEAHPADVEVRVDRKRYGAGDLPWLVEQWCTNRNIRSTNTFEIRHRGEPVFGFHDDINEAWATESERTMVEQLVREQIVCVLPIAGPNDPQRQQTGVAAIVSFLRQLLGRGSGH